MAVFEVLVSNDAVSAMIRESKTYMIGNHMQSQKADGNILLNEALLNLVVKDIVDPRQAYMKSSMRREFGEMLKAKGYNLPEIEAAAVASDVPKSAPTKPAPTKPAPGKSA